MHSLYRRRWLAPSLGPSRARPQCDEMKSACDAHMSETVHLRIQDIFEHEHLQRLQRNREPTSIFPAMCAPDNKCHNPWERRNAAANDITKNP